ncbi:MAG TPA: glycoside hydrolase family 19 protein [Ramlibacter sp.]|uniref:glycoside hydrolase family 19 protein n=1 Tax=Ramlibacter sp. TaxID=1917967 RepID=UPI002D002A9A|nr:glycoside hydrolase family 19 protein [Ramlibacter sp.]HVZ42592.1 glycoside hydrolase family 19 protein [Ramlibacter sp.]
MVSAELLKTAFPQCARPAQWSAALAPALRRYDIATPKRLCAFLAQIGYESGQFNRLAEDLTYKTAVRLQRVWPKRFPTQESAMPYVDNPKGLANFVYAKRLGNGDEASGDGFLFRGRGLIQITGRSNYRDAGHALGIDLEGHPDLLLDESNAAMSAAWFWSTRGCNALADDGTDDDDLEDFTEITRRINGGTVGLKDRLLAFGRLESCLA